MTCAMQVDETAMHMWTRLEDRAPQPAYKLNETNPGSAVTAEVAAALAAGSMVFRERGNRRSTVYTTHCLHLGALLLLHPEALVLPNM